MIPPNQTSVYPLNVDQISSYADLALAGITREFPNAPGQVLNSEADLQSPRKLHPAFYGCFDWHSAVHGHWMLTRLLRLFPDLPQATSIRAGLNANLTIENLQVETGYFTAPNHRSFERTYGWAWLLKLVAELSTWNDPMAVTWVCNLQPLAEVIISAYLDFLPRQTYPIRAGTHPNTAFGLAFALDFARLTGQKKLGSLIEQRGFDYFGHDIDYPANWEPGGNDFLSPALIEADLMTRILPQAEFATWFRNFLPQLPDNLLKPVMVSDRSDLQLVHLDGLNLSRAWCMNRVAACLAEADPARDILLVSAEKHAKAGLAHIASGHYGGEHWLASFAVYLLFG